MAATEVRPYVVGIDIGGTNTVFGIVDAKGNVLASNSIKTQRHQELDKYVDELYAELSNTRSTKESTYVFTQSDLGVLGVYL